MQLFNREGQSMKNVKRAAAFFSAIVGISTMANGQTAPSSGFFDWSTQTNPTTANFTAAPFLSNNSASASQVAAELNKSAAAGKPLAVKVIEPLTDPAAIAIFNNFAVKYVICDFEDASAVGRTRAIADQVLNSAKSKGAFVGNFNFYPRSSTDGTRPPTVNSGDNKFYQNRPFSDQYTDSRGKTATSQGKLFAAPQLYPGSPDYRTGGTSDLTIPSGTPNIRSALFTLPIVRATVTENGLVGDGGKSKGDQFIPWVSRFNNYGNNSLDNDPAPGYQFHADSAHGTANQLLGRGDFQAQILHYRLRGADSVNLFAASAGSVVGDSLAQNRSDVANGWKTSSVINSIFTRSHALANLSTNIGDKGGTSGGTNPGDGNAGITQAGAVWSGVYDKGSVSGGRRLAILMSNLGTSQKTIDLPNLIGGFHTISGTPGADDDYVLAAGQHRLLTFTLNNNMWRLNSNSVVFSGSDSFGSLTDRNGTGVPEPTTIGLLGIGAVGLLTRRRRTA